MVCLAPRPFALTALRKVLREEPTYSSETDAQVFVFLTSVAILGALVVEDLRA